MTEDGMMVVSDINNVLNQFVLLRKSGLHNINMSVSKKSEKLSFNTKIFSYNTKGDIFLIYEKDGTFSDITFAKNNLYAADMYQIIIGDFGIINFLSRDDRDVIYDFLTGENNNTTLFGSQSITLSGMRYTFEGIYNEVEKIKAQMLKSGNNVTETDRLIVNIPIIQWQLGWHYASVFYLNWLTGGGDINADVALTNWLQSWPVYRQRINEYENVFAGKFLNNPFSATQTERFSSINSVAITDIRYTPQTSLYPMHNLQAFMSDTSNIKTGYLIEWDSNDREHTNFSITTIVANEDSREFNAWVGAFGSVSIQHCFGGMVVKNNEDEAIIDIDAMIVYIRDGFNFSGDNQPLGEWKNDIFSPQIPSISAVSYILDHTNLINNPNYLSNAKLNDFRLKYGIGRDFNLFIQTIPFDFLFHRIVIRELLKTSSSGAPFF